MKITLRPTSQLLPLGDDRGCLCTGTAENGARVEALVAASNRWGVGAITLDATEAVREFWGISCRLWRGRDERARDVEAWIAWVCVDEADGSLAAEASQRMQRELVEVGPTEGAIEAVLTLRSST